MMRPKVRLALFVLLMLVVFGPGGGGRDQIAESSGATIAGLSGVVTISPSGFAVPNYGRRPAIGRGLGYSTFFLGGDRIAVDRLGSAYVVGTTCSRGFLTTPRAYDRSYNGGCEAFVAKLNRAGSRLVYSTYLGGSGNDRGRAIAVDGAGRAYVIGSTRSRNFPTTRDAFDRRLGDTGNPQGDVFVARLNATGSSLSYSTYVGGRGGDEPEDVAVDKTGQAYVVGYTSSRDFPTTAGAFDRSRGRGADAFVTRLNAAGSSLAYSTFLGGSDRDSGYGITVDGSGSAYVTGSTNSADFPTTAGAYDRTLDDADVFVAKIDSAGSALAYSTYLGGARREGLSRAAIAVDAAGSAYVVGDTNSSNFPTSNGAFDRSYNGGDGDAFVTKLNPVGSTLAYSSFLGGSGGRNAYMGDDYAWAIALDGAGRAYVTGNTYSANFPTTAGALDRTFGGVVQNHWGDAFVVRMNAAGSSLLYSTYLGGRSDELAYDIAVDRAGNAYVTGGTGSADFPTTVGAFSRRFRRDGYYVAKFRLAAE